MTIDETFQNTKRKDKRREEDGDKKKLDVAGLEVGPSSIQSPLVEPNPPPIYEKEKEKEKGES